MGMSLLKTTIFCRILHMKCVCFVLHVLLSVPYCNVEVKFEVKIYGRRFPPSLSVVNYHKLGKGKCSYT